MSLPQLHPEPLYVEGREGGVMRLPQVCIDSVVFLYTERGGNREPVGTGFFVYVEEGGEGFGYVVTCKHVVRPIIDAGLPIDMRVNRADAPGVRYKRLEDQWVYHQEPEIDLAVCPSQFIADPPVRLVALHFESTALSPDHLKKHGHTIEVGDEISFVGLFTHYTGTQRNIPVVRSGHVALATDEPLPGEYGMAHQYVLECQAYPGNSGGPVYVVLPPVAQLDASGQSQRVAHVYLLGVIAAFYPDKQELVHVHKSTGPEIQVYTHFGISTAVPVGYVQDILYGDGLTMQRKEAVAKKLATKKPDPASKPLEDAGSFTKGDFQDALRKVSRPNEPQPDEASE